MDHWTRPKLTSSVCVYTTHFSAAAMESASFGMRLRPFKEKNPQKATVSLTAAERSQRWRDNLKNNPDKFKDFKGRDAQRKRTERRRQEVSDDQKEIIRARNRERQRAFRERRKGKENLSVSPKKKIMTRNGQDKQRSYWRQKQRESREKRSSQKIRRKKEKDRTYVNNKRNPVKESCQKDLRTENTMSQSAVKKAAQRAKLPKNPENFVETVHYILKKSPKKRQALEEKGLITTVKDQCNRRIVDVLKEKLRDKKLKKVLLPAMKVMKKYKMLKTTSMNLGVHLSGLNRISDNPRKSRVDEDKEQDVENFFNNISTPVPDRKSVKRKEPEGRRILDRPLKSVYSDYKEAGGDLGFSTFAKKVPRNIQTCTKQPWYSCLCEYCTNVDLKIKALNDFANKVNIPECKLNDRYHAVNVTLCDKDGRQFHHKKCVERECEDCCKDDFVSYLSPVLTRHGHEVIKYTMWETQDTGLLNKKGNKVVRVMMVKKTESLNAMVIKLADHLHMLANHLFVARWQQKQFTSLINNIPPDWVVLNLDFAENYSCISQMEIQTAHWGHNQATIHPIITYYNCNQDDCEISGHIQETLLFISNDLKHDSHAVNCFIKITNDHLQNTRALNIAKEIQYCDGCAGQYKSCIPFCDLSYSMEDFGFVTERNFYGSRHGKGPSDGAGAVIKSAARRAVNSQNEVINCAKDLAEFAEKTLTKDDEPNGHTHRKRTIFYVDSDEIDRNRPDRISRTVPGTRSLHSVRSQEHPRKILARHLSCFCSNCNDFPAPGGKCDNGEFVESFREIEILQGARTGVGERGDRGSDRARGVRMRDGGRGARGNDRARGGSGDRGSDLARGVRMRGGGRGARGNDRARGGRGARGNERARGVRTRGGGRGARGNDRARGGRGARGNERARGVRTRGGGRGARGNDRASGVRTRGGGRGARGNERARGVRTRVGERESNSESEYDSDSEEYSSETSSENHSLSDCESIKNSEDSANSSKLEEGHIVNNSHSEDDLMDISGLTGIFESLEACDERLSPILTMLVSSDLEAPNSTPDQEYPNIVFDQETLNPLPESQDLDPTPHLETLNHMPILEGLVSKSDQSEANNSIPRPGALDPTPKSQKDLDPTPKSQKDLDPTLESQEDLDPMPILEALNTKSDQEVDNSLPRPGALDPNPESQEDLDTTPKSQEDLDTTPKSQEDLDPTPHLETLNHMPILEGLVSKLNQSEANNSIPRPGALDPTPKSQKDLDPTPKSQKELDPTLESQEDLDPMPIREALNTKSDQEVDSTIPRPGDFLQIKYGNTKLPAVVDHWPFVKYFKKDQKGWMMLDILHTVIEEDLAGKLEAPSIKTHGRKTLYIFEDLDA